MHHLKSCFSVRNFVFIAFFTFLSGCGSPSKSTGPCDYQEEKFNMRVIEVKSDPNDENLFIVTVDFDGNVKWAEEPQSMSEVRGIPTTYNMVIENNIREGAVYTGTVYTLKEENGNCLKEIVDWDQKLIEYK